MRSYPANSPQAAARIVALTVVADGDVGEAALQPHVLRVFTLASGTLPFVRAMLPHEAGIVEHLGHGLLQCIFPSHAILSVEPTNLARLSFALPGTIRHT